MCGIAGFWDGTHRMGAERSALTLRRMTRAIRHRGPDDEGFFQDCAAGIALGHRRLSVIDLSPQGHQPMVSASGRFVMIYNGEVYNHRILRRELAGLGAAFRGHSDSEVILAAIEHWGLGEALRRFIGMFAFALWDRHERSLQLVRDRLGIKPLYHGWVGKLFVFASELKALTAIPGFANAIDRDALCLLLRHGYIPAPHSIYRGLHKLPPGTLLSLTENDMAKARSSCMADRTQAWWSAREAAESGIADRLQLADPEAVDALDRLLRDAVALRMEADVPFGAFLSGGIDSSLVVALMQAQSARPVQTFSIGFREKGYDEAAHAAAVAKYLDTDHHDLYFSAGDALAMVPKLPEIFDEPFSDSSQLPTLLLSQLTRRNVTVSLSGDGGDELFGGYRRYLAFRNVERGLRWMSPAFRSKAARSLAHHAAFYESLLAGINAGLPEGVKLKRPRAKVEVLADMLQAESQGARYRLLMSHTRHPAAMVPGAAEMPIEPDDTLLKSDIERMMYRDLVTYLPGDILTKVDRASMAVSLEARVPLLDHRVVEFAWRVPLRQKIRRGRGKWLLRQVLDRYVPRELMERPKQGFGVPVGAWLRGPLRDWAETLLDERRLREEGFFEPQSVRRLLADHLAGNAHEGFRLWDILMFQAWLSQTACNRPWAHDEVAA
ncbi:MAG: asparagine synthase (glutamine-hydrolyzing) [Rhodanobacteraceae bacterium]